VTGRRVYRSRLVELAEAREERRRLLVLKCGCSMWVEDDDKGAVVDWGPPRAPLGPAQQELGL
jgi:hypothetical protein